MHRNKEQPPLAATREIPHVQEQKKGNDTEGMPYKDGVSNSFLKMGSSGNCPRGGEHRKPPE